DSILDSTYETIPSCTMQDDTYLEDHEDEQNELHDHIIGALKECLEEIDIKGKELFKKYVSNADVEISLGRLAREAIGDTRAKHLLEKITTKVGNKIQAQNEEDFVVTERGAGIDDELSLKLERFKVKTVNIGGVVKENPK
nr:reverse transcriptase domain, ribonuclease H-like domain protein [Tanacetum cinerariifolium]